jgi:hypothetical protein
LLFCPGIDATQRKSSKGKGNDASTCSPGPQAVPATSPSSSLVVLAIFGFARGLKEPRASKCLARSAQVPAESSLEKSEIIRWTHLPESSNGIISNIVLR